MINIRLSRERGHGRYDWLDTRHSFSFADYYDPRFMGFRVLRVINQDLVAADSGFPQHPHRDMEIISLVLEGCLRHRDSLGTEGILRAGDVQRMTAGTGIRHSEWNPSATESVHFLQIWIEPAVKGLLPSYQERTAVPGEEQQPWVLLAAPDSRAGAVSLNQDVELWRGRLQEGRSRYAPAAGRHAWLQVISGSLSLNGQSLEVGDGAAVSDEGELMLETAVETDFLLFDLA